MMEKLVEGAIENLCIIMLLLSVATAIAIHYAKTNTLSLAEEMFRWVAAMGYGVVALYTFILHAFFQSVAAKAIGWQPSPFEFEVAIANLAFGVLGVLSFRATYAFRVATVIGVTCWLWGDAAGHIRQMAVAHNLAPGNAGVWFWCDVIVPVFLITLLAIMKGHKPGNGRPRA